MDDRFERLSAERVEVSRSLVGMASGSEIQMEQSAVQRVLARDVELEQSAAMTVRAEHVSLDESGAVAVFANRVDAQNTAAFIVVSPSLSGNVRSVIDVRTAFAFGAGYFVARALLKGARRLTGV
jgi:hypothetical protein